MQDLRISSFWKSDCWDLTLWNERRKAAVRDAAQPPQPEQRAACPHCGEAFSGRGIATHMRWCAAPRHSSGE